MFLILLKEIIGCELKDVEIYHLSHSKDYLKTTDRYNLLISNSRDFMENILSQIVN